MSTILVRIEACLNSRPITPLSNDPSDLSALTPGLFLIGRPQTNSPESDLSANRLQRWQRTTQLFQQIWQRWSKEYLTQLQVRQKWPKLKRARNRSGRFSSFKGRQSTTTTLEIGTSHTGIYRQGWSYSSRYSEDRSRSIAESS